MKNLAKIVIALLVLFSIISCDNEDEQQNPPADLDCPPVEILGYKIEQSATTGDFGSSLNSLITPTFTFITAVSQPQPFQSAATNNAIYNPLTKEYLLVSGEKGKLTTVNTLTATSTVTNIPLFSNIGFYRIVNAPVIVGGNVYYGCYNFTTEVFSLTDANFNIIPSSNTSIALSSLNGYELPTFTSTTDEINHIYFVLGNRIITYNTSSISAANVSAAIVTPAGSSSSESIISLEFKETNKLYAIMENWGVSDSKLVELDISNPLLVTKSEIYDFGFRVNPDFFSTLYDDCTKMYYVSTMSNLSTFPNGQITKLNLSSSIPTLESTTSTTFVELGLTLKK
jgi:hypothetical protein